MHQRAELRDAESKTLRFHATAQLLVQLSLMGYSRTFQDVCLCFCYYKVLAKTEEKGQKRQ